MSQIERTFTRAPWEKRIGYCRALKAGHLIYVTGTAPVDEDGQTFAPNDAYAQARKCLEIIEQSISELGANRSHITRTRMFVTDISLWDEFGRAHAEVFSSHPPTTTMVEVKQLISKDMLIEIEADGVIVQGD